MRPNVFVPLALTAFLVFVPVCFSVFRPRRAVLVALVGGWLFLPHFDDHYRFLFFVSKASFVPTVVWVGSALFDGQRWFRLRPRLLDLPVAVLCLEAFFTAINNGFDTKEAVRSVLDTIMAWGTPYLLGRMYFASLEALRDLASALVGGALVYVVPTLWEIRMSPQLHQAVYGYRPFGFDQVIRFGGWRPSVFMQHGLALGLFMAIGTLVAYWMWRTDRRAEVAGLPMRWVTLALAGTTMLCKSTGAILLLVAGIGLLEATRRLRTSWLVLAVLLLPPIYCGVRVSGWTAQNVVELVRSTLNEERAGSLQFRLDNENLLVRKAMQRPWLGWGRYGRSFVYNQEGELMTVTDSLWVIILGTSGALGLAMLGATILLPVLAMVRRFPARTWHHPRLAPVAALALALTMWAFDALLNAMITPFYPLMAGALVSFLAVPAARLASGLRRAPEVEPAEAAS